jgi:hypothetical protein
LKSWLRWAGLSRSESDSDELDDDAATSDEVVSRDSERVALGERAVDGCPSPLPLVTVARAGRGGLVWTGGCGVYVLDWVIVLVDGVRERVGATVVPGVAPSVLGTGLSRGPTDMPEGVLEPILHQRFVDGKHIGENTLRPTTAVPTHGQTPTTPISPHGQSSNHRKSTTITRRSGYTCIGSPDLLHLRTDMIKMSLVQPGCLLK